MYSANNVSIHIINWYDKNELPITNLRLQKLLYFVQGEFYAITRDRLIDDDFFAWQLGPVIPKVYNEYSIFSSFTLPVQKPIDEYPQDISKIIDLILMKYVHYSTWELVDLSRSQDPWKYNFQIFGFGSIIPYDSIVMYFKSLGVSNKKLPPLSKAKVVSMSLK